MLFPGFIHAYIKHNNLKVLSAAQSTTDRMVTRVAGMKRMRQKEIVDKLEILLQYFSGRPERNYENS